MAGGTGGGLTATGATTGDGLVVTGTAGGGGLALVVAVRFGFTAIGATTGGVTGDAGETESGETTGSVSRRPVRLSLVMLASKSASLKPRAGPGGGFAGGAGVD